MRYLLSSIILLACMSCMVKADSLSTDVFSLNTPAGYSIKHNKRNRIQIGGDAVSHSGYPNPFIVMEYCSNAESSKNSCDKALRCNEELLRTYLAGTPVDMNASVRTSVKDGATLYSVGINKDGGLTKVALLCHSKGAIYSYVVSSPMINLAERVFDDTMNSIQWKEE